MRFLRLCGHAFRGLWTSWGFYLLLLLIAVGGRSPAGKFVAALFTIALFTLLIALNWWARERFEKRSKEE